VEPETHYARSGDVAIAYQVVGEGPFDVVFTPGFLSHVELVWTTPPYATIFRRLASRSRLILLDKRGTGMSDPVATLPTLETRMDDVRAVMDAAGSARATIIGEGTGAAMSLLFAATYPKRTTALVSLGLVARLLWAPDYPWGMRDEEQRALHEFLVGLYESREKAVRIARAFGRFTDEEAEILADYFRRGGSPAALDVILTLLRDVDVRHVLPAVRVPTLLVHGVDDRLCPIEAARYAAGQIPGAKLLELPGQRHLPAGATVDSAMDEVETFLTEVWEAGGWDESEPDRVLTTILFTDIVDSTEHAAVLGDRAWHELLERHHEHVRRQLVRFRGAEVNTVGDGFVASFDGPARAIRCARSIVSSVRELDLEVRIGLHTGECELVDGKVSGIAVHTGARVAAEAAGSEVLVSSTVKDLVAGSGIAFSDRGLHDLKGVPGEWRLFAIVDDG
jgi:pimeloyl-ACP methyl ester carboxylesterase/class 3 adenylate cyclase